MGGCLLRACRSARLLLRGGIRFQILDLRFEVSDLGFGISDLSRLKGEFQTVVG